MSQSGAYQTDKKPSSLIGALPAAYIVTAFVNFGIGTILGALLSIRQAWWPLLRPIHAELNPYGWLTLLIYGMTYAILTLSAGLTPPWPIIPWLQLLAAELGVLFITTANSAADSHLLAIGLVLQGMAPALFLFNILAAVFASRRTRRHSTPTGEDTTTSALSAEDAAFIYQLFRPHRGVNPATDKIAQRGTDVSLMIFLVSAVMAVFPAIHGLLMTPFSPSVPADTLAYYGWIAGTVLAVALHLYTRYAGLRGVRPWQAQLGQLLWLAGLFAVSFGPSIRPTLYTFGLRVLGLAFVWTAIFYLRPIRPRIHVVPATVAGWLISWTFALILGITMIFNVNPLSAASLHLLFLGWITTLVYSVGYSFFPTLLHREPPTPMLTMLQLVLTTIGALVMLLGLSDGDGLLAGQVSQTLVMIGGITAASAAWLFFGQWVFGRPIS